MSNEVQSRPVESLGFGRIRSILSGWFSNRVSLHILADLFHMLDMVVIIGAALIAKFIYIDVYFGTDVALYPYFFASLTCALIANVLLHSSKVSYSADLSPRPFRPVRLFIAVFGAFMVLLTVAYVFKVSELFSRGWLIIWFSLSFILLVVNRAAHTRIKRWLVATGIVARRIAIIGLKRPAEDLADTLGKVSGLHIAAVCDAKAGDGGMLAQCGISNSDTRGIDEVAIVASGLSSDEIRGVLAEISGLPVQVRLCVDEFAYDLPFQGVSRLGETQFINVRGNPINHWGQLLKTIEDYVLGILMLLILLPLFAVIAIAIKLDSRGPVFFRQRRHGLNHSVISVFKFRTMRVEEDGDVIKQAQRNDPRVTRVGAFLRMTSLDELPQLINVLRGEMSLVGPRPHAVAHNEQYGELLKRANYSSRHLVKPGITGWAQINGFRGPTDDPALMRERVRCDLEYIDNWSIWFDLEILLLTLVYGFMGKNAV